MSEMASQMLGNYPVQGEDKLDEEASRQYYFMDKARKYVEELAQKLGRRPTCCVTTFGCQMNPATMTA